MYEVFGHTADVGLRMRAADLDELFADAGRALFAVIVVDLDRVEPRQRMSCRIDEPQREYLLLDWLNELLYHFESERLLLKEFTVHVSQEGLQAMADGETFDPRRHQLDHEVKAVTYHNLRVQQTADGWEAEVILDL